MSIFFTFFCAALSLSFSLSEVSGHLLATDESAAQDVKDGAVIQAPEGGAAALDDDSEEGMFFFVTR